MEQSKAMPKRKIMTEEEMRKTIAQGGGHFIGVQEGTPRILDHALFVDPRTGATLALPVNGVTSRAVAAQIKKSRRAFTQAQDR